MKETKEELINKIATIILVIVVTLVPATVIPKLDWDFPKMIILLSCGLGLLLLLPFKIKNNKLDKADISIMIFSLLAILSTAFSSKITISLFGTRLRFEGVFIVLTYVLIYFHAKYSFIKFKKFENILIVVYIGICLFTFVQYYLPDTLKIPIISGRPDGTFGNTNFTGSFVSLILPAFIIKFIINGNKKYLFCSVIAFCTMLMSLARSGWIAFVVYMLITIVYIIAKKNKTMLKRLGVLIVLFAICFLIIVFSPNSLVGAQFGKAINEVTTIANNGINGSMGSGRIKIWEMTVKLILQKPLLGCGVDNLYAGLAECAPLELIQYIIIYNVYVDKAHNEYLQIAATMGIPALISYTSFLVCLISDKLKDFFKSEKNIFFVTIIISYLVQAFFNISVLGVAPIFWFVLGIASKKE